MRNYLYYEELDRTIKRLELNQVFDLLYLDSRYQESQSWIERNQELLEKAKKEYAQAEKLGLTELGRPITDSERVFKEAYGLL